MINYKNMLKILMIMSISLLSVCLLTTMVSGATIENNTTGGIKKAINDSNNGDTIVLTPGTYKGVNNTGIAINKNITISGNGTAESVIINASKTSQIFSINSSFDVTFINITFLNGKSTSDGGAIYGYPNSKMTFINCVFINNSANNNGGAIYSNNSNLIIANCVFINNSAGNYGGGVHIQGGKCSISKSNFTGCLAQYGGAISNMGNLTISSSTLTNNNANRGAGIYNNGTSSVSNNTIRSNIGSAIANDGNLTIKDNNILDNTGGSFEGNGSFKNETKISKIKTTLSITSFKALFKKSNTIKTTLRDANGLTLAKKQINFYINGKLIGKANTNSEGVANLKYTFKTRKAQRIIAKFSGDNSSVASNSKTLSVTPKDITYLTLAKFTPKLGKKTTFKATLRNHIKNTMKGRFISFYADSKYLGKVKTNSKGVATLTKTVSIKGLVSFKAKYSGTKNFHSSSQIRKVSVK